MKINKRRSIEYQIEKSTQYYFIFNQNAEKKVLKQKATKCESYATFFGQSIFFNVSFLIYMFTLICTNLQYKQCRTGKLITFQFYIQIFECFFLFIRLSIKLCVADEQQKKKKAFFPYENQVEGQKNSFINWMFMFFFYSIFDFEIKCGYW
jgi:hypothetical protein